MTVRILVADDSYSSRKSIISHLPRTLHFDVTEAANSQETVTLLNIAEFELLLLNLTTSQVDNAIVLNAVAHALCHPKIVVSYSGFQPAQAFDHVNVAAVTFIQLPLDKQKIEGMLADLGFL
ncbi:response regulator [Salinimonas sp. HHU 13199]|uniref:Response regulator n=1 Tax=Salinimonas profundi TaxID=2729140 RepID=A0ABR8LQ95_9ALTE|nr:hypothetical protein [Salinimonas profundi]MBD3586295.1 response regulator [Salinimonas profundi]